MNAVALVKEEYAKRCKEINDSRTAELKLVNEKHDALKNEAWKNYIAQLKELGCEKCY